MAIDNELPIRLAEVPALIAKETGERVNFKTVYRWTVKGRRGVRLQTVPGIRKRTTREAVLRFIAAVGDHRHAAPAALSRARRREQIARDRALVAAGR